MPPDEQRYYGGLSGPSPTKAQADRFRTIRNWALIIITNLVSIFCMYYVLSGAHLSLIWGEIRSMSWHWVILACVSDGVVFVLQSWRWMLILTPVAPVSLWT